MFDTRNTKSILLSLSATTNDDILRSSLFGLDSHISWFIDHETVRYADSEKISEQKSEWFFRYVRIRNSKRKKKKKRVLLSLFSRKKGQEKKRGERKKEHFPSLKVKGWQLLFFSD